MEANSIKVFLTSSVVRFSVTKSFTPFRFSIIVKKGPVPVLQIATFMHFKRVICFH